MPKDNDRQNLGPTRNRPQWIRTGSVFIRAVHLAGAGIMLGGHLFEIENATLVPYLILAVVTGILLFLSEWARHFEIYREVAGWSTFIKILILLCVPVFPKAAFWIMLVAFIIAGIGAHLPRRYRHRLLF